MPQGPVGLKAVRLLAGGEDRAGDRRRRLFVGFCAPPPDDLRSQLLLGRRWLDDTAWLLDRSEVVERGRVLNWCMAVRTCSLGRLLQGTQGHQRRAG